MSKEIKEVLNDLGLEKNEIKVYLVLIKYESITALKISQEARIDRTTTYDILERLIDKGIASFILKNKVKHFNVLNPANLLLLYKEKYNSLEQILPQLQQLRINNEEETKFEIFQGLNGIKSILIDLINSGKDYYVIGIKKEYEDMLSYFHKHATIKLDNLKVTEYAIVAKGEKFKKLKSGKYKYIENGLISPITTLLYEDKVIFFIWTEPKYGILLKNKTFAIGYKEYFEILWKQAKK